MGEGKAGVHRIVYTGSNGVPTARITANPASGAAPLNVSFSGATSTDPDGDALTYRWDFTNDGTYDATGVTAAHTYATGTYTAKLEVNDGHGHTATATQQIQAGNTAPTLGTVTPAASLTWAVGDPISFSATATDPQQGTMPASRVQLAGLDPALPERGLPHATRSAPSPVRLGQLHGAAARVPLAPAAHGDGDGQRRPHRHPHRPARPEDGRPDLRQLAQRRRRDRRRDRTR